ncbi:MAG: hypothetical protein OEY86_09055 [Nitrospira sp.]|nr:hypothetical protein [Nitrospira sp.]
MIGRVPCALALLILNVILVGCGVRRVDFNTPIHAQGVEFIRPGETTLQQVVERLGGPEDLNLVSDEVLAEFRWSTTRSASLNLGYLFRFISPVSPSMTMSGTGINIERLLITCDKQLVVRSYAFGKAEEHAFFEFWPF